MISAADAKRMYKEAEPLNYRFLKDDRYWRRDLDMLVQCSARCNWSFCVIEYDTDIIHEYVDEYLESFGYEIVDDYVDSYGLRTLKVAWAFAC